MVHVLSHICLQGPQCSSMTTVPFRALPSPLSSLRRGALPGLVKSRSASGSPTGTTQGRSVIPLHSHPRPHMPRFPQPGPAGTRALWIPAAAGRTTEVGGSNCVNTSPLCLREELRASPGQPPHWPSAKPSSAQDPSVALVPVVSPACLSFSSMIYHIGSCQLPDKLCPVSPLGLCSGHSLRLIYTSQLQPG